MKSQQDNSLIIVLIVLIVFIFFGGFSMMGFGGMGMYGMMGYGNSYLCSSVGGIWCYLPILNFIFMLLMLIVFVVLVTWIVRRLQNGVTK